MSFSLKPLDPKSKWTESVSRAQTGVGANRPVIMDEVSKTR